MRKNWVIKEVEKINSEKNIVILENPKIRDYLDRLLLEKFWPVILSYLKETDYNYSPKPEIESELSYDLERVLSFVLFDGERAFFRGKLRISVESWMLESDLFLPLSKNTDTEVIFQILGNSRFRGFPPTLTIEKEREDSFYQIDFHSGKGAGWGRHSEDYLKKKIRETISINKEMYELSKSGITAETVGVFLTLAYKVYEAF